MKYFMVVLLVAAIFGSVAGNVSADVVDTFVVKVDPQISADSLMRILGIDSEEAKEKLYGFQNEWIPEDSSKNFESYEIVVEKSTCDSAQYRARNSSKKYWGWCGRHIQRAIEEDGKRGLTLKEVLNLIVQYREEIKGGSYLALGSSSSNRIRDIAVGYYRFPSVTSWDGTVTPSFAAWDVKAFWEQDTANYTGYYFLSTAAAGWLKK